MQWYWGVASLMSSELRVPHQKRASYMRLQKHAVMSLSDVPFTSQTGELLCR